MAMLGTRNLILIWYYLSYKCRDGRLQIGDEIVNVNGRRLRGLSMDSARGILSNYSTSENFTKTMNTKRYWCLHTIIQSFDKIIFKSYLLFCLSFPSSPFLFQLKESLSYNWYRCCSTSDLAMWGVYKYCRRAINRRFWRCWKSTTSKLTCLAWWRRPYQLKLHPIKTHHHQQQ